jgi:2-polyprenyl-3-methyl-5-hydroxy-6-metoxy-1,4-benzoquinol methylase
VTRDLDSQVLALFDHAPKRDRVHVRGRFRTCPVAVIDAEVPRSGRVLEVGCGHGLVSAYLAMSARDREVLGVDIDARKIAVASHAQSHAGPTDVHVSFRHLEAGAPLPDGEWDAIVVVDVLYLLDDPAERALLAACVDRLAEHGVLVIKETDIVPRWKHRLAKAQEVVSTKILRITEGSALSFTPVAVLADQLRELGLDVVTRPVDKGYLHPHALVVGRRKRSDWHSNG